jgi:hypothetical protein
MRANLHAPYRSKGRATLSCSPLPIRCRLVPLALPRSRAVIWARAGGVAVTDVGEAHALKGRARRKRLWVRRPRLPTGGSPTRAAA